MKPIIISLSGSARHGKGESCNIIERKLKSINKKCLNILQKIELDGNY